MPFLFLIVGTAFVISAVRGTSQDLLKLVKNDVSGPNNFIYWFLAILAIGSVGYVDQLRPLSRAFMVLVIVSLLLSQKGFFTQFENSVKEITE